MSTPKSDSERQKRVRTVIWVVIAVIVLGVVVGLIYANVLRGQADAGSAENTGAQGTSSSASPGAQSSSSAPSGGALPAQDPSATADPATLVRENSIMLNSNPDAKAQIVEFLDFECEACGAFYPVMEEFRKANGDKIDYVVRYFPLPGHNNSMNAAVAAEAANQQGKFEDMYNKLFTTQKEWGEKQDSQAELFRSYAEQIGLDMAAYDKAVADPATQARVQSDIDDGKALGVNSTPTFFINGQVAEFKGMKTAQDVLDYFNGFVK